MWMCFLCPLPCHFLYIPHQPTLVDLCFSKLLDWTRIYWPRAKVKFFLFPCYAVPYNKFCVFLLVMNFAFDPLPQFVCCSSPVLICWHFKGTQKGQMMYPLEVRKQATSTVYDILNVMSLNRNGSICDCMHPQRWTEVPDEIKTSASTSRIWKYHPLHNEWQHLKCSCSNKIMRNSVYSCFNEY